MSHQPVCSCGKSMKVKKNGVKYFERARPDGKIMYEWSADMWECPDCQIKILVGFGENPIKINPTEEDVKKAINEGGQDSVVIGKIKKEKRYGIYNR